MHYDTIIRNGLVVTPAGPVRADLALAGERIAAIGLDLTGDQSIDAAGKLVIPGAIDPHVHLEMPAGPVQSSDDWVTGTIAAACGGTTTVIDFAEPGPAVAGEGDAARASVLGRALAARRGLAAGRAVIDFGLHMTLTNARPETLAEVAGLIAGGCVTFKTYLTYEGFKLSDAEFVAALETVGAAGGMVTVHAENDAGIAYLRRKLLAEGKTEPRWHPRSRPAGMEAEAIERALALAEAADCPLYVVHISTGRGADAVARARARGQLAFGETCPQYLLLTEAAFDRPGFEGAKFICSPPLRGVHDNAALWWRLAGGDLQTVGTDHCPFFFAGQKDLGHSGADLPPFTRIPGGMPGIEGRLALLYTAGVAGGKLSLARWVEVCCSEPARVLGLAGRKGALIPGADADVVLFDPAREVTFGRAILHEHCDYSPYEGTALRGYPALTMLRGRVICRDGQYVGGAGGGQYLARRLG